MNAGLETLFFSDGSHMCYHSVTRGDPTGSSLFKYDPQLQLPASGGFCPSIPVLPRVPDLVGINEQ